MDGEPVNVIASLAELKSFGTIALCVEQLTGFMLRLEGPIKFISYSLGTALLCSSMGFGMYILRISRGVGGDQEQRGSYKGDDKAK